MTLRKLVLGNWKMNGSNVAFAELVATISAGRLSAADVWVALPATLIAAGAIQAGGTGVTVGGQDCHAKASGAHTGDLSAEHLRDAGARFVIVGHSERRRDHGETNDIVVAKAAAARRAGLVAIVCVGETLVEYQAGRTLEVVADRIAGSVPDGATGENTVISYEPMWAIGTGLVPAPHEIATAHAMIRARLVSRFGPAGGAIRIIYGGSVTATNAAAIFAIENADGGLIGGASLNASSFLAIVAAAQ